MADDSLYYKVVCRGILDGREGLSLKFMNSHRFYHLLCKKCTVNCHVLTIYIFYDIE